MSAYDILGSTLKEILSSIQPSRDDYLARMQIINDLRVVVGSVENLRGAIVEPYGSFVSNLYSRWGDLDVSIDLPNGSHISYAGKKHKQALLGDVLRVLRQRGGWGRIRYVPNARVPILKLNWQSISCDISIDNVSGQLKSKILYWISMIDGRFGDMVLLVKEWAKAHDINGPRNGTFNSYSLSLLVIYHLQPGTCTDVVPVLKSCVPAILPPLKDIYPVNMVDDLIGIRADAERLVAETCAANIARFKSDRFRKINQSTLAELLVSFFAKFRGLSSMASEVGVCPFTGELEDLRSNMRWMPKTYALFIEDPFEQPANTARTVGSSQLTRISQAFERTHSRLISVYPDKSYVLATLVRPHMSLFVERTPLMSPMYHGAQRLDPSKTYSSTSARPATRPQIGKTVYTPKSQVKQFGGRKPESHHSNVIEIKPAQPYHSRGQQIWKPRSDS